MLVGILPTDTLILTSYNPFKVRAQKSLGLIGGSPNYFPVEGFENPDVPARTYHYSADGRLYAYGLPTG
jgi:translation initiation factor 2A